MKLSRIKLDLDTIERGMPVKDIPGLPGVVLQARGEDNADWRRLQAELFAAVPPEKRGLDGRIAPEAAQVISIETIVEAGIVGWSGIEDDAGAPIAFSKDMLRDWLEDPEMRRFADGCSFACRKVAQRSQADREADAKNS